MFWFGFWDEDKCFTIDDVYYCDVKVTLGIQVHKITRSILFHAVCFGYKGGLMRKDAEFLTNLKLLSFNETIIDDEDWLDKSDITWDMHLRVNMDMVATTYNIT